MNAKKQSINTIIGSDTVVDGSLTLQGGVIVYGQVNGNISAGDVVRISVDARVSGDVTATDAIIGGKVLGDVKVDGKIILGSKSILKGDLTTSRLIIEEGAQFEGNCNMTAEHVKEADLANMGIDGG